MATKFIRPFVKIHGGKRYLYKWVIQNFPKDYKKYCETHCGACSVFLNKLPSDYECINDVDPKLISIINAIRNKLPRFQAELKQLDYCEQTFKDALNRSTRFVNSIDAAVNEFTIRRMSRGGLKKAFAWSDRQRGGMPGDVNAWNTIIEHLPMIAQRLKQALVYNQPAINFIKENDSPETFFYCDPPYLHETRRSTKTYEFEMSKDDHIELAQTLNACKGKVMISGYDSKLYQELYINWNREEHRVANHSSQTKIKQYKTECIWKNY